MQTDTVYLLCFAPGLPRGPRARSSHYLGSCVGPAERRLAEHVAGRGSPLVAAAAAGGLGVRLALSFRGDRRIERAFKNRKVAFSRICPLCQAEAGRASA